MTDDDPIETALNRIRRADARVRQHEAERRELAAALVDARRLGVRPRDLRKVTHYDRNHIGRILKAAGLTEPRGKTDVAKPASSEKTDRRNTGEQPGH
mgnify:CR=1 FL=1|jgi:hypothetical protein